MPRTSTEARPRDAVRTLDGRIGHLLRCAYQQASANTSGALQGTGLSPPRFAVLLRLLECGPLSQNLLGRLVAMEPANIHDMVRGLKAKGLVATAPDPADNRRRLVALTAKGRDLLDAVLPAADRANEKTIASLDARERDLLFELLERIAGDRAARGDQAR